MVMISQKEAEEYYGPQRMKYYRANNASKMPRTRLTMKDFEDRGIDLLNELWTTLQDIKDPKDKIDSLLKMMKFVLPTVSSIDIQHSAQQDDNNNARVLDLAKVPTEKLVSVLTGALSEERRSNSTTPSDGIS